MTAYRTICAHCGREESIIAIGTAPVWRSITVKVEDTKVTPALDGRIEMDTWEMDVDEYQCSVCGESSLTIDKLVKVIHPWSDEWRRTPVPEEK